MSGGGDGLGHELPGTSVGAVADRVNSAARLGGTEVGVVVSQTDWGAESEHSGVRVHDFDVVGVSRGDALRCGAVSEEGHGRVQSVNCCQTSAGDTLASDTGNVPTQTVSHDDATGESHASVLVQEVNELGDSGSDQVNTVSGSEVVSGLSTRSPVHNNHVEFSASVVGVANLNVDS